MEHISFVLIVFFVLFSYNRDNLDDPLEDKATLLQQLDQVCSFYENGFFYDYFVQIYASYLHFFNFSSNKVRNSEQMLF